MTRINRLRIQRIIAGNRFLSHLLMSTLRIKNQKRWERFVLKSRNILPLEYQRLNMSPPLNLTSPVIDNNLYGHGFVMQKFAQKEKPIENYIEHGVYWGNHIQHDQPNHFANSIITMSNRRKRIIEEQGIDKKVFAIGPYIQYAESFLSEKNASDIKKDLGETALVFLGHSTSKSIVRHSKNSQFDHLLQTLKSSFETILVCVYYLDIENNDLISYLDRKNCTIVCAGHKRDPFFLSRLRSIIELSTSTFSIEPGTHVGYCVALNRPHKIIAEDNSSARKARSWSGYTKYWESKFEDLELIQKGFSLDSDKSQEIFEAQQSLFNEYWGGKISLSSQELYEILD